MALLEVKDLCRTFRQGDTEIHAVDHVCFSVEQGDMLAIVGQSGSGKTTLLNLLGCTDKPSAGQILLDGTLSDLKKHGTQNKNLTVEYRNGKIDLENNEGIRLLSDFGGRAVFSVDSSKHSIPEAVNIISKNLEIVDLSVNSESIENTVAALYKEYGV